MEQIVFRKLIALPLYPADRAVIPRLTRAVGRTVLAAAGFGLLSPPTKGSIFGVDAGQTVLACADLAGVRQTDRGAVPDVAVGAPPAEEPLARRYIWHTVGSVLCVLTDLAGGTLDVSAGLPYAFRAGRSVFTHLKVLALVSFTRGSLWNADLAALHLADFVCSACPAAGLGMVSGCFCVVLRCYGGGGHQKDGCAAEEHVSGIVVC